MATLPENLATRILLWFSVKSLMRFKCVCKSWRVIIENSRFIVEHLNHTALTKYRNCDLLIKRHLHMKDRDTFLLLSNETSEMCVIGINNDWRADLEMLASCNGIICLRNKRDGDLALWNPATREFKSLPESGMPRPLGLTFNNTAVGFGFDFHTDDYKVVRIIFFKNNDGQPVTYQVEAYYLSTGCWSLIDTDMPVSFIFPNRPLKAYLNGIYYWCAKYNLHDETILSLDISNEEFQTRALPSVCTVSTRAKYGKVITVLKDSIALILFQRTQVRCFEIWVLNDYVVGETWTKSYTIGPIPGGERPLGFSKDGKMFLEYHGHHMRLESGELLLEENVQLISCNPITQEIKYHQVEGESGSLDVLVYDESLVPIIGGNKRTRAT